MRQGDAELKNKKEEERKVLIITLIGVLAVIGIAVYVIYRIATYLSPYDIRAEKKMVRDAVLLERAEDGEGICMVYYYELVITPIMVSDKYVLDYGGLNGGCTVYNIQRDTVYTITYDIFDAALPDGASYGYYWNFFKDQGIWYIRREVKTADGTDWYLLIEAESGEITGLVTREYVRQVCAGDEEDEKYDWELDIFDRGKLHAANGLDGLIANKTASLVVRSKNSVVSRMEKGEVMLYASGYALPENNEALYSKFPGIKKYRGKNYVIEINLKNRPDAEEIMSLFIEEGEEVSFEKVAVPSGYSVDGKWHEVDSCEEWNKWYAGDGAETMGITY